MADKEVIKRLDRIIALLEKMSAPPQPDKTRLTGRKGYAGVSDAEILQATARLRDGP